MTKKEQTTSETPKVPLYKKASFPWTIIVISMVATASFITGWHTKTLDDGRIKQEAAHMVQLSKPQE